MSEGLGHAASVIPAFAAGFGVGTLYFALLWRSVRHLTGNGAGWRFVLGLVLRLALIIGALAGLVLTSVGPSGILAAMLGVALARLLATRFVRARIGEE